MTAPERIYMKPNDMYENGWARPIDTDQFDEEATEYVRADLAAVQPAQVRVKPLVWEQCQSTLPRVVFQAKSCFGRYVAWPNGNWKLYGAYGYEQEGDIHTAMASANADYEARILAALEPQPAPEALHRSFPDAGDGRPMPPMGDQLMIAGLSVDDARFVAVQLAQHGLTLTAQPDPRDEVIARLVEAAQICVDTFTSSEHSDLRAALAAAKAVQHG